MALIDTLVDPFDGTALDTALWIEVPGATTAMEVADGELRWTRTVADNVDISQVTTLIGYDVPGATVRLAFTVDSGVACGIQLLDVGDTSQRLVCYFNFPSVGSAVIAWYSPAGIQQIIAALDPTHTQARIVFALDGTFVLATSSDGVDWIECIVGVEPLTDASVRVSLAGIFPDAVVGTAAFQGINTADSGPVSIAGARWDIEGPPGSLASARWDVAAYIPPVSTASARWDVAPRPPMEWTGATAGVTVGAGAGEFTPEAGYWLTGASAALTARASGGALVLGPESPVWAGATAQVIADTNPGELLTGTQVAGDNFAFPVVISGLTGTATATMASATLQVGEPYTHGASRSWWFRYTAPTAGVFTVTSPGTSHFLDVYAGDTLSHLELVATATRTTTTPTFFAVALSAGTYYLRVAATAATSLTLSYALVAVVEELVLENRTPTLVDTPEVMRIGLLNAAPGEDIVFSWHPPTSQWIPATTARPITLTTLTADETGAILSAGVPIPEVGAGSYTVSARGLTSGRTDTVTVYVARNPPVPDPVVVETSPPEFMVGRWSMNDPAPGGLGDYTFPINPSSMSSPHAPRIILAEHTTAAAGQPLLWEGGLIAHEWQFAGYLETQAFHDKLVAFADLNHRCWLTDHRGRQWRVGLYALDMKPVRNVGKPWAHNYVIQAHIYGLQV